MKYLLSILCLFTFSCDSGGGDTAITMDDLNGDWWILSICKTYVGTGCIEDEEDTCPPEESVYESGEYTKIIDGSLLDCDTDNEPECEPNDYDTIFTIINGNTFQLCETDDIDCDIGTMELNGDFLELTHIENEGDCELTVVMILERKE